MTVTVVHAYAFTPDGDVADGKAAAAELVQYFKRDVPGVQLSLWLEDRDNPLHHYHITVFDSDDPLERVRKSAAIKRFVDRRILDRRRRKLIRHSDPRELGEPLLLEKELRKRRSGEDIRPDRVLCEQGTLVSQDRSKRIKCPCDSISVLRKKRAFTEELIP